MNKSSYVVWVMKKGMSQTCYKFFSTLGNPTRLAVLESLVEESKNVTQLTESLRQEQSMVSHNLKPLVECGFVQVERRGKERIYSVNHETVDTLFKAVENHAQKFCPTGGKCLIRGG